MLRRSVTEKFRRRLSNLIFAIVQLPRILRYRILSTCTVNGRAILYQPLQAVGLGEIVFSGHVRLGVFPSPFFFSTCGYIEARNDIPTGVIAGGNPAQVIRVIDGKNHKRCADQ